MEFVKLTDGLKNISERLAESIKLYANEDKYEFFIEKDDNLKNLSDITWIMRVDLQGDLSESRFLRLDDVIEDMLYFYKENILTAESLELIELQATEFFLEKIREII